MRNKPVFIVVIRANLDDVICGARPTLAQARVRMREVLADIDGEQGKNNMRTWDASGVIAVAIFRVLGDKVELEEQEEPGDGKATAAA